MIFEALSIIRTELGVYIGRLGDGGNQGDVVLGNISLLESNETDSIKDKVVITLVNSEEESALKNSNGFYRMNEGGLKVENPPVYLNLYLLFSANWPDGYDTAIRRLSNIIEFFQRNNIFTIQNSPNSADNVVFIRIGLNDQPKEILKDKKLQTATPHDVFEFLAAR